jgi:murein DD-endopeptidase MepM/ murein hydrolase activator NlpD
MFGISADDYDSSSGDSGVAETQVAEQPKPPSERDRRFYAPTDGTVIKSGWENSENHDQGYGYRLIIRSKDGSIFTLGHLDENSVTVKENGRIAKGQQLGLYADPSTGNSSAPNLHVEWRNPRGERLDAMPHLSTIVPDHVITSRPGLRLHPTEKVIKGHKGYDVVGPLLP